MAEQAALSSIAPYYGGKRTLAPRLLDILLERLSGKSARDGLGVLQQYVTPFHGSLPDVLELRGRGFAGTVIANDAYGYIHNLAVVLTSPRTAESLVKQLALFPFGEATHAQACRELGLWEHNRRDDVEREGLGAPLFGAMTNEQQVLIAGYCLIAWWMGRNGEVAGTDAAWDDLVGSIGRRFTLGGGDPGLRWENVKASIPAWYASLALGKTTLISERCEKWLPSVQGFAGEIVYLDPPYLGAPGARYAEKVKDGTGSLFSADDFHAWLAEQAHRIAREGAVVGISYYRHERLAELYPSAWWDVVDLDVQKNSRNAGDGEAAKAPEVLLVNKRDT